MPVRILAILLSALVCPLAFAACQENPFRQNTVALQSQVDTLKQDQGLLAERGKELQDRATQLDRNNQELESLLAQSKQREQLLNEQLDAVRDQLKNVSTQLAQVQSGKEASDRKAESLLASLRQRGGAVITANNSLADSLPRFNLPNVQSRVDGDVIRIDVPAEELFEPGTNRLRASSTRILDTIAAELEAAYPRKLVGIEGHTSKEAAGVFQSPGHKTSVEQAEAVFDYLATRARMSPGRLFVTGHGPNHPVYSNTTEQGRRRNSRIEIVIYPEEASL
jgi:flagellar motor protein MotB